MKTATTPPPGARRTRLKSIRRRVLLASGVVLALLIAVGVASYRSLSINAQRLDEHHVTTTTALLSAELESGTSQLQRSVQTYIHTGLRGLADTARDLHDKLAADIDALSARVDDPEMLGTLERMASHLDAHAESFEEAVLERALRTELVQTRMGNLARNAETTLEELRSPAGDAALVHLLSARHATLLYHDQLDAHFVDLAKQRLAASRAALHEHAASVPADAERALAARRTLQDYERSFLRSVQATRAYLFLVNVVMAGESAEFAHEAARLRSVALAKQEELRANAVAEAASLLRLDVALTVVAVILGALSSWLIGRSIVRPLQKMTHTFQQLARGSAALNIPGRHRRDEVGEMARAAEIFRARNAQTEQLLERSRKLSADLADKQDQLEKSNAELEQVMYTVSHDLKSPLITSLGLIGMIRDMAAKGDVDRAVSQLERLERPNRRMSTLISDFLSFSRVGRAAPEPTLVELGPLVRGVLEDLESQLRRHAPRVQVADDLPAVLGDPQALSQVFENLITNALKYGRGTHDPVIEIGARRLDDHVEVFVRDNGPGIAPEYHARVFELFQRLDNDEEGTGVGLAIVDRVMKHHHGEVHLESTPGEGCTFRLRFPQHELLTVC